MADELVRISGPAYKMDHEPIRHFKNGGPIYDQFVCKWGRGGGGLSAIYEIVYVLLLGKVQDKECSIETIQDVLCMCEKKNNKVKQKTDTSVEKVTMRVNVDNQDTSQVKVVKVVL